MHVVVGWILVLYSGSVGGAVGTLTQTSHAIPCVPAAPADPRPWEHNHRVLQSFPPDTPRPQFLGRFSDASEQHELHLWRDSKGIFGQWLSPVLDADSPTSRLYEAAFDANSGSLSFTSRIPGSEARFVGQLQEGYIRGVLEKPVGETASITLARVPDGPLGEALRNGVSSRAQFDCMMVLFRRY